MSTPAGTVIAGRYQLLQALAARPACERYRALDRDIEVEVELWLFRPELVPDATRQSRLMGAAVEMRGLGHPHLVRMFDCGPAGSSVYVTVQPGQPARPPTRLANPADSDSLLVYAASLADALEAIHAAGQVHGRLSPEDVVEAGGLIKLAGAGLYVDLEPYAAQHAWGHLTRYWAPEVLRYGPPTPASDVYSLAVMLAERMIGEALLPSELCDRLAIDYPELYDVLGAAMALAPYERTASPQSLAMALRMALAGTTATHAVVPERGSEPVPGPGSALGSDIDTTTEIAAVPDTWRMPVVRMPAALSGQGVGAKDVLPAQASLEQGAGEEDERTLAQSSAVVHEGVSPRGKRSGTSSRGSKRGAGSSGSSGSSAGAEGQGHAGAGAQGQEEGEDNGPTVLDGRLPPNVLEALKAAAGIGVEHAMASARAGAPARPGSHASAPARPPLPTPLQGSDTSEPTVIDKRSHPAGLAQAPGAAKVPVLALEPISPAARPRRSRTVPPGTERPPSQPEWPPAVSSAPPLSRPENAPPAPAARHATAPPVPRHESVPPYGLPVGAAPAGMPDNPPPARVPILEQPGMRPHIRPVEPAYPPPGGSLSADLGRYAPPAGSKKSRSGRMLLYAVAGMVAAVGGLAIAILVSVGSGSSVAPTASPETAPKAGAAAAETTAGSTTAAGASPTGRAAAEPAATSPSAAGATAQGCPAGMVLVSRDTGGPFCIDAYEAPGQGQMPTVDITLQAAQEACQSRGARLCEAAEWEPACRGKLGATWPYGFEYAQGSCNLAPQGQAGRVAAAGSYERCQSAVGAFDMSGNVAEWIVGGAIRGGSALDGSEGRCSHMRKREGAEQGYPDVGFRCCAEPR